MIKFIYFDLGGVVIKDFSGNNKWAELTKEIGVTPGRKQEFEDFWGKYEQEICTFRDVESLKQLINDRFGTKIPENYSLLQDGFARRLEENRSIWPVMEFAKKHFRVGLLTNMYPGMFAAISKRNILPPKTWDIVIDSSKVGFAKPDPRIFDIAQQKTGVPGSEILLIENTEKHVQAAMDFGWNTFLYDSSDPDASSGRLGRYLRQLV